MFTWIRIAKIAPKERCITLQQPAAKLVFCDSDLIEAGCRHEILLDDRVTGMEFERTELDTDGKLRGTGETWSLDADVVFTAVGQTFAEEVYGELADDLEHRHGRLLATDAGRTSVPGIWAGGDCILGHDDLTVTAVQDGKIAAIDIDRFLKAEQQGDEAWQT